MSSSRRWGRILYARGTWVVAGMACKVHRKLIFQATYKRYYLLKGIIQIIAYPPMPLSGIHDEFVGYT